MKPRPYQGQGLADIRAALSGIPRATITHRVGQSGRSRALVYVLPTGGGKTAIYAWIAQGAASKGRSVLVLEHRKELIKQAGVALARVGVRHRIIAPPDKIAYCRREQIADVGLSYISDSAHVAVASVQTLGRRMAWLEEFAPDIIIIDEAHHSVAGTWSAIMSACQSAVHIGVTATPVRTNGQGLRDAFDTMVLGPSVRELIQDGYLVPPKMLVPPVMASFDDVAIKNGDLDPEMQAEILNKPEITGDAVKHYAAHTPGLPAIVFCCNRKHAADVAAQFQEAGWRFHVIDGTMEGRERDELIRGLVSGAVQGLVSVDLISEGTDIPLATVAIMLRRTLSEGLFLQMCGRVLRPVYAPGFDLDALEGRLLSIEASGKTHGWVLDHVNNYSRHGAPHTVRQWSLEGVKRKRSAKKEDDEEREDSRQCPQCYIVHDPAPVCPECGHVYAPKRAPLRVVDGNLVEVAASAEDREQHERMRRARESARDKIIAEARAEKDRLRRELRELAEQVGVAMTWREILDMKPKALRQAINELGGELFMRGTGS